MKTVLIQRRYCVEITVKQMLSILKRDYYRDRTLRAVLEDDFSVHTVDYDGHFGPNVFYTVDIENDTPELHKDIQLAIRKFAK